MTALAAADRGVARLALVVLGVAAVVGARWSSTIAGVADPVLVGVLFGVGLLVLGIAAGVAVTLPRPASIPIGLAGGAVLVLVAVAARVGQAGPSVAPAVPLLPWAMATVLVATAEEVVLRGVLLDLLRVPFGTAAAVLATSAIFALMHVPLYGWHVVPLDLGVGLWLAGLRLLSGDVAAPAIAHAVADLATSWL